MNHHNYETTGRIRHHLVPLFSYPVHPSARWPFHFWYLFTTIVNRIVLVSEHWSRDLLTVVRMEQFPGGSSAGPGSVLGTCCGAFSSLYTN